MPHSGRRPEWGMAAVNRVRDALFDHTVRGALSPPHTSRCWDRKFRDKPETEIRGLRYYAATRLTARQDKRHVRQTYLGRSARVATRPESQVAPPHIFNILKRLSPPSHGSADRRLRPVDPQSCLELACYPLNPEGSFARLNILIRDKTS